MNQAIFLDRDGTIIKDGPFLDDPNKISFLKGAVVALKQLQNQGFLLVLITNQSGIGRGYFPVETVERIHARLRDLLKAEGIELDGIYYCPHAPNEGCVCRKPETDLFRQAIRYHDIDPTRSYSIGDKLEDAEAGKRVGCTTFLISDSEGAKRWVDFTVPDLATAARQILERDCAV